MIMKCVEMGKYIQIGGDVWSKFFLIDCYFKCAKYVKMMKHILDGEGLHKTTDYKSTLLKCINCYEANKKYTRSLKEDHQVGDINYKNYQRIVDLEVDKTKTQ